jgi:hypothetical protein
MCLGGGGLLLLNPLYDLLDFAPIRTDTLFLACFPERSTIPRPPPNTVLGGKGGNGRVAEATLPSFHHL